MRGGGRRGGNVQRDGHGNGGFIAFEQARSKYSLNLMERIIKGAKDIIPNGVTTCHPPQINRKVFFPTGSHEGVIAIRKFDLASALSRLF
jgi:hypothetical protein